MINLLTNIMLSRRSVDDEGWMNILIVIVMAVFWIISGVIKAMKTRSGDQQQQDQTPARKTPQRIRERRQQLTSPDTKGPSGTERPKEQKAGTPKKRITLADLREAARKFAAEAEKAFTEEAPKPKVTPKPSEQSTPPPTPNTDREVVPETKPVAPPIIEPSAKKNVFEQTHQPQLLADLNSDYHDPEKLRKAILHYEILGPPLSLRE